jgi:hypothetical protein
VPGCGGSKIVRNFANQLDARTEFQLAGARSDSTVVVVKPNGGLLVTRIEVNGDPRMVHLLRAQVLAADLTLAIDGQTIFALRGDINNLHPGSAVAYVVFHGKGIDHLSSRKADVAGNLAREYFFCDTSIHLLPVDLVVVLMVREAVFFIGVCKDVFALRSVFTTRHNRLHVLKLTSVHRREGHRATSTTLDLCDARYGRSA